MSSPLYPVPSDLPIIHPISSLASPKTPDEALEKLLASTIKSLHFSSEKPSSISPRSIGIGPIETLPQSPLKSLSLVDILERAEDVEAHALSDKNPMVAHEKKISEIAMFYFRLYVDDFASSIKQTARSMIILVNEAVSPDTAEKYAAQVKTFSHYSESPLSSEIPSAVTLEVCQKVSDELEDDLKKEVSSRLIKRHSELIAIFRDHYSTQEIEYLHNRIQHPLSARVEAKMLSLAIPKISDLMDPIKTTITNRLIKSILYPI